MNIKQTAVGSLIAVLFQSTVLALTPQQQAAVNALANLNTGIRTLYNQAYAASSACAFPNCNITNVSLADQLAAAKQTNQKVYDAVLKARAAINSTPTNILNMGANPAFEYQSKLEALWQQTGAQVTKLQAQLDQQQRAASAASAQAAALASLAKSYKVASVIDSVARPYQAVNLRQYTQGGTLLNETILKRSGDARSGLTYVQVKNAYTGANVGLPTLYRWGACAKPGAPSNLCVY